MCITRKKQDACGHYDLMVMSGCKDVRKDPNTGDLVRCVMHTVNGNAGVWYENAKCKHDKFRIVSRDWEEPKIKSWRCGDCGYMVTAILVGVCVR